MARSGTVDSSRRATDRACATHAVPPNPFSSATRLWLRPQASRRSDDRNRWKWLRPSIRAVSSEPRFRPTTQASSSPSGLATERMAQGRGAAEHITITLHDQALDPTYFPRPISAPAEGGRPPRARGPPADLRTRTREPVGLARRSSRPASPPERPSCVRPAGPMPLGDPVAGLARGAGLHGRH